MIESIKFGDVFKHKEKEYVFLAKTEELVYAAEILSKELTSKIDNLYQKISKYDGGCVNRIIYCYVMLKTEEFKDRMIFFGENRRR